MTHLVDSLLHPREFCVATGQGDVGQQLSSHSLVALRDEDEITVWWQKYYLVTFIKEL